MHSATTPCVFCDGPTAWAALIVIERMWSSEAWMKPSLLGKSTAAKPVGAASTT
jgi:hypothetical protein